VTDTSGGGGRREGGGEEALDDVVVDVGEGVVGIRARKLVHPRGSSLPPSPSSSSCR